MMWRALKQPLEHVGLIVSDVLDINDRGTVTWENPLKYPVLKATKGFLFFRCFIPSGLQLMGTLQLANPNVNGQEAVILCHGLADNRDSLVYPALAAQLAREGIASLRFDFRGNGESEGTFRYANYKEEVEDLRAAVEFLRHKGLSVVAIVGHSKGAITVLQYHAKYNDVPRVAAVAPRFHMREGIKMRFGDDVFERVEREGSIPVTWRRKGQPWTWSLTKEDLAERVTTDMEACCSSIAASGRPGAALALIHGTQDTTMPASESLLIQERVPGSQLRLVEGACHNFRNPQHAEQLLQLLRSFAGSGTMPSEDSG